MVAEALVDLALKTLNFYPLLSFKRNTINIKLTKVISSNTCHILVITSPLDHFKYPLIKCPYGPKYFVLRQELYHSYNSNILGYYS